MFNAINISGSGLTAAKKWMEVTSNNIVNTNTTNGPDQAPYARRTIALESKKSFGDMLSSRTGAGVQISTIKTDESERLVYNPSHPNANQEGYVRMPNIDLTAEMTNMMVAQKMYEVNTNVLNTNNKMIEKALEIGKI